MNYQYAVYAYLLYRLAFLPYDLWVYYVAIMRLKMVRDAGQLTDETTTLAYIALARGYIMDLLVNLIYGSIQFKEFPKELTLSSRLTRWSTQDENQHYKIIALKLQAKFLNNIDPAGVHTG